MSVSRRLRPAAAAGTLLACLTILSLGAAPARAQQPPASNGGTPTRTETPVGVETSVKAQTPARSDAAAAADRKTDPEQPNAAASNEVKAQAQATPAAVSSPLPHDLSPLRMFLAADIVVQGVMASLMLASVVAWSIWFAKVVELRGMRRRLVQGIAGLSTAQMRVAGGAGAIRGDDWIARCLSAAREEVELSRGGAPEGIKERIASRLAELERIAVRTMRTGTGILASIGSTAPFVGLFGTVWGIMNSFIGISRAQTTNLAVVAPGIAEALLATAIGLVAAIPAVLFYNHLTRTAAANKALLGDGISGIERLVSRELDGSLEPRRALKLAAE